MRRRTLLAIGSMTVMALGVTACAPQASEGQGGSWSIPSSDPTTTISYLTWETAESLKPALDAFSEAHPTITVQVRTVPYEELNTAIEKDISSRKADPDVYLLDPSVVPGFAFKGFTEDLTDQFSSFSDRWDPATVEAGTVDGKLSALPLTNSTQLLFYNKDLLDAAGIATPSADPDDRLTWQQVSEDAKKAIAAGAGSGLLFGQPTTYYQLEPLPVSLGGSPGATGDDNLTPDVTSDEWVDAMTWYQSLFTDGVTPLSMATGSQRATFAGGKAAFIVDGPWTLASTAEVPFNWGVAPMPYMEGGEPVTPTGSFDVAMNPFSTKKEAAAIFMKFLTVDGGTALQTGDLPASAEDRQTWYEQPAWQAPQGADAAQIVDFELANTAVNRLRTVGYVEFEDIMKRTFTDIGSGADPKEALESANDELVSAWAKYQ